MTEAQQKAWIDKIQAEAAEQAASHPVVRAVDRLWQDNIDMLEALTAISLLAETSRDTGISRIANNTIARVSGRLTETEEELTP
jgi:hypothetical protein